MWLVRLDRAGGQPWARTAGRVAVDCHARGTAAGRTADELDTLRLGGNRGHAEALHAFASLIRPGHLVLGVVSKVEDVLVGTVTGDYRHEPGLRPDEPHTLAVEWGTRTSRRELRSRGTGLPGWPVRAVARLDPDPEALAVLAAHAAAPADQVARSRSLSRSPAPTDPGPPALADLPGAPRRLGRPADWTDHGPPRTPCPPASPALASRHRYVMPVCFAAAAGGPNLLVIAANPSCPDDEGTFVRQVRNLAEAWGAASCGVVNLVTRRTLSVPLLAHVAPDDLVGPRQRPTLHRALRQADVVVLAHGGTPAPARSAAALAHAAERDHLYARLHELTARRALVVVSIDGKATQPAGEPLSPAGSTPGPPEPGDRSAAARRPSVTAIGRPPTRALPIHMIGFPAPRAQPAHKITSPSLIDAPRTLPEHLPTLRRPRSFGDDLADSWRRPQDGGHHPRSATSVSSPDR